MAKIQLRELLSAPDLPILNGQSTDSLGSVWESMKLPFVGRNQLFESLRRQHQGVIKTLISNRFRPLVVKHIEIQFYNSPYSFSGTFVKKLAYCLGVSLCGKFLRDEEDPDPIEDGLIDNDDVTARPEDFFQTLVAKKVSHTQLSGDEESILEWIQNMTEQERATLFFPPLLQPGRIAWMETIKGN